MIDVLISVYFLRRNARRHANVHLGAPCLTEVIESSHCNH